MRSRAGRLQARPAGSTRPTLGLFNGEEIFSGGGDRSLAADLDHDPLRGPPVTFYDHAESKAAARMRRTGSVEADLAVDNTVYSNRTTIPAIIGPSRESRAHTMCDEFWHGTGTSRIDGDALLNAQPAATSPATAATHLDGPRRSLFRY